VIHRKTKKLMKTVDKRLNLKQNIFVVREDLRQKENLNQTKSYLQTK
jgi:hypothetical protein